MLPRNSAEVAWLAAPAERHFLFRPFSQLMLLATAAAAGIYARTAIGPLQETLRLALSLTDNQVALLQGPALALPAIVGALPLGFALTRYSRVRILFIAVLLNLLATVATAFAASFEMLFVARCVVGLAAPVTGVAAYSLLADLYAPARRGKATMTVVLAQVGGSSLAFLVGGELLSAAAGENAWRNAVLWMAVFLAPVLVATLLLREPVRMDTVVCHPKWPDLWPALRTHRGIIVVFIAGMSMVNLADGAALVWAAPTLIRGLNLTPDHAGALMGTVLLVSGIAGPLLAGLLADFCQRVGGPRLTVCALAGLAVLSLCSSAFPTAPDFLWAGILITVFLTAGIATSVMVTTLTIVVMPHELRSLCVSIQFAAGTLFGFGVAPMAVSLLSGALGGPSMIGQALALVCACTSLLGITAFALGARCFSSRNRGRDLCATQS